MQCSTLLRLPCRACLKKDALRAAGSPDCDHDFPVEMRELAYEMFAEHLGVPAAKL